MALAHLYKITHTESGRFYFGKHKGEQQNGYWGSGLKLQDMYKKYPKSAFQYQIIMIGNVDYVYEMEEKLVNKDLLKDQLCMNLTVGGMGVRFHTAEQLAKCNPTGRKVSELTRQRMSKAALLKAPIERKPEWNVKTSASLKAFYEKNKYLKTPEAIAKMKSTKDLNPTGTGKWMNKDGIQIKVKLNDIEEKLSKGWIFGTSKKHITPGYKEKLRQSTTAYWARKGKVQPC